MLVGTQTIRVRYFDYLTNDPDFQIDLIFDNPSDLKIDKIEVKNKELLMIELKKRQEFNKGESGKIKLPPPPPKKKGGNRL